MLMRKIVLLAVISLGSLVSAQKDGNERLRQELENQEDAKQTELDFYIAKYFSSDLNRKVSDPDKKEKNFDGKDILREKLLKNKDKIDFFFNGQPFFLTSTDTDQLKNSNTDALQEGSITGLNRNFNGQGINITVFDGGRVYEKHINFGGENSTRVTNKEDGSVRYSSHATGVTGMIGGEGRNLYYNNGQFAGNAKGVAPLATFDAYSFYTTTLPGDTTPKNSAQKLLLSSAGLSNHSYGGVSGWSLNSSFGNYYWEWSGFYSPSSKKAYDLNGTYYISDRNLDNIIYNNPHMIVVKSAGNSFGDGPEGSNVNLRIYGGFNLFKDDDVLPPNNCSQGFDCIPQGSVAKNIITVGSTEKIESNGKRYTNASDVVKASYSSAGPRDDGAIKPDITAVGSNILYSSTNSTGSNEWGMGSGTSYSAPLVTGIIGLWTEVNRSLFNKDLNAASAKTLLIHSAQEAGNTPGPDVWHGWGFADAKKGAELLVDKSNNKIIFEDKTLENNAINTLLLESDGKQPLKVTISWIDPEYTKTSTTWEEAYNNRESTLINDLDLRITNVKTNEIFYPWKLDANSPLSAATKGDNTVDNVEQVVVKKPVKGTYKVEISHKGNLVNNDTTPIITPQSYSIIATGYTKLSSVNVASGDYVIYPTLLTEIQKEVYFLFTKDLSAISVYDMSGRLLHRENANGLSHAMDLGKLPKGVFIIKVDLKDGSEPYTAKILKR